MWDEYDVYIGFDKEKMCSWGWFKRKSSKNFFYFKLKEPKNEFDSRKLRNEETKWEFKILQEIERFHSVATFYANLLERKEVFT